MCKSTTGDNVSANQYPTERLLLEVLDALDNPKQMEIRLKSIEKASQKYKEELDKIVRELNSKTNRKEEEYKLQST